MEQFRRIKFRRNIILKILIPYRRPVKNTNPIIAIIGRSKLKSTLVEGGNVGDVLIVGGVL